MGIPDEQRVEIETRQNEIDTNMEIERLRSAIAILSIPTVSQSVKDAAEDYLKFQLHVAKLQDYMD